MKFIKNRLNRAIKIIQTYVDNECALSEYEEAAQIFVAATIRLEEGLDEETIVNEFLPLLYEEQRSCMTADITVIKLEWIQLR